MSKLVVDASVAVKWLVSEPLSDEALAVLAGPGPLIAPDLLVPEVANVLWKKVRRGELTEAMALERFEALSKMGLEILPTESITGRALALAVRASRTVYDALYVVLAEEHGCQFVTADEKLVNALRQTPDGKRTVWLGAL